MTRIQTLEYNSKLVKLLWSEYNDVILDNEIAVTSAVLTLAMEKIYNDNNLDERDEVLITKRKSLGTFTKIKLKKKK